MSLVGADIDLLELDKLLEDNLVCTSRQEHDCSITAFWRCESRCTKTKAFWCEVRHQNHIRDMSRDMVCKMCSNPKTPDHWRVLPV